MSDAVSSDWQALDRHAFRREQGLPTVSVLLGSPVAAARMWQGWARHGGLHVISTADASPGRLVPALIEQLTDRQNFYDLVLARLAEITGCTANDLGATLTGKTLGDLEPYWDTLPSPGLGDRAMVVAREVVRAGLLRQSIDWEQIAVMLDPPKSIARDRGWRMLAALDELLPAVSRPAVFIAPHDTDVLEWITAAAPHLADLAEILPRWPVGVGISAAAFARYLDRAPESRARTLLSNGAVSVAIVDSAAIADRLRSAAINPAGLGGTIEQVAAVGAGDELISALTEAARLQNQPGDAARSAAERFLFELLESLPATAGCFTLNARLDFPFGAHAAEVDLWSANLGLAVEIDGYHHFTDADRYRRDRRKDWELQSRGYLVLRVLADDVMERVQEALGRVLAAVEHCRGRTISERLSR